MEVIHNRSSAKMEELGNCSVHLVVTSPPYNVGKEYEDDIPVDEWRENMREVWDECHRVLVPGGRLCINVANTGRRPYQPLTMMITADLLDSELQWVMRGDIIWNKGSGARTSTAWGSYMSAANPFLRDVHEYILVFSKNQLQREDKGESDIGRAEFANWTKTVWRVLPEHAQKIGHPAPFPVEIPYRLIKLYSFRGDTVLDPFLGSGTTAVAAKQAGRKWVGYETSAEYVRLAEQRVGQEVLV